MEILFSAFFKSHTLLSEFISPPEVNKICFSITCILAICMKIHFKTYKQAVEAKLMPYLAHIYIAGLEFIKLAYANKAVI